MFSQLRRSWANKYHQDNKNSSSNRKSVPCLISPQRKLNGGPYMQYTNIYIRAQIFILKVQEIHLNSFLKPGFYMITTIEVIATIARVVSISSPNDRNDRKSGFHILRRKGLRTQSLWCTGYEFNFLYSPLKHYSHHGNC